MEQKEHVALYRKLRPSGFEGVVGQEQIVRTLSNQIINNKLTHAYLFTGGRGTGKTSVAKIFAKSINCESPLKDGSPCMTCASCKAILEGGAINIIEIDAASNNSVDDIRGINEAVKYPPTIGKYKVYIIDEVHMLSTSAFNALLKTLEEPPSYVVFILATTDPQKIPTTILSRCMRFNFRRIPTQDITQTIMSYMKKEGVQITERAAKHIAELADGGLRDALSLLESCTSFYMDEEITFEKVLEVMNSVDTSILFKVIDSVITKNTQQIFESIQEVYYQGRNFTQFVSDLIDHLGNLLIAKTVDQVEKLIDKDQSYIENLKQQAEGLHESQIINFIKEISLLQGELKTADSPRILIQTYLAKLVNIKMDPSVERLLLEVESLNKKIDNYEGTLNKLVEEKVNVAIKQSTSNSIVIESSSTEKDSFNDSKEENDSASNGKNLLDWNAVLERLNDLTKAVFLQALTNQIEENAIKITFKKSMKPLVDASLFRVVKALELEKNEFGLEEYSLIINYEND